MNQNFNWDDLRFFLAVARARTVSLAGRRTGTDHTTVSRRIDALERSLGKKLFERNRRGYNLTRQGEALLDIATAMEAQATRLVEAISEQPTGLSGTIRISTPEGFGNFFLASRIDAFIKAYPKLTTEIVTIQQIVALSRREADFAITMTPPTSGNYITEHLVDYQLQLYASTDYLANHPPIQTLEDLIDHTIIGYIDELIFTKPLDYLREIMPKLRARLQNSSLHAQLIATSRGAGLCVLPVYIARTMPNLIPVLPETVSLSRSYWIVSHADMADMPLVRIVRRFLQDIVEQDREHFSIGTRL